MSATLTWSGLNELHTWLRELPRALAGEGADIVERHATNAFGVIHAGYPSREGDLKKKLTITHSRSAFGAKSVIRNTSKHARPFESGSQVARQTKSGANRGTMPANPIFSKTVQRWRRAMNGAHRDMLIAHGLQVSGEP